AGMCPPGSGRSLPLWECLNRSRRLARPLPQTAEAPLARQALPEPPVGRTRSTQELVEIRRPPSKRDVRIWTFLVRFVSLVSPLVWLGFDRLIKFLRL